MTLRRIAETDVGVTPASAATTEELLKANVAEVAERAAMNP